MPGHISHVFFNWQKTQKAHLHTQYNPTTHQSLVWRGLFQDDVGQQHVEDCAEWATDRVESHPDKLQAQVVEDDHADEDSGQRQHLSGRLQVEFDRREIDESRAESGQQLHDPAEADRHHTLIEGDKQRRVQLFVVQQIIIKEHHCYGDEPVQSNHGCYPKCSEHESLSMSFLVHRVRAGQSHPQDTGPLQLCPVHEYRRGGTSCDKPGALTWAKM